MNDSTIATTTAAALFLWPLGLLLIALDAILGWPTGQLGIYGTCAAGVLNIRGFFCQQRHRERNAFEVGRDYQRGAEVRSLR